MRRLVTLLAVLFVTTPASAQNVTCPTTGKVIAPTKLSFTASVDHDAIQASTGTAILTSYQIRYFQATNGAPITQVDIGKPTPSGNIIVVTDLNYLHPPALNSEVNYCATVAALGPGGSAASAPSAPFVFPANKPPTAPTNPVFSPSP